MPKTRRSSLVLLLLVLVCGAVFTATGCGGDDGGDDDVASVLKDTFGSGKPVKSGKLNVALALDAKGLEALPGPVSLKLSGPFESAGDDELPSFDFDLALDAAGQAFTAGAVSTGDKGFLTVQGEAFAVGDELFQSFRTGYKQAQKDADKEKGDATFKTLGIDPLRWLENEKDAGVEQVGGADTTHITGTIDVPAFLVDINTLLEKADEIGVASQAAQVPATLTQKQRDQIAAAIKTATVDIFTGKDDRLLRRIQVAITFEVPEASRKDAGGLQSGTLSLDLTIADLNKDQTITAPKNARPLEQLTSQLNAENGAAAPGTTGTATTPAAPAGAAPEAPAQPTAPAANPEYLTCLDEAGTDLAKVQECAKALTK